MGTSTVLCVCAVQQHCKGKGLRNLPPRLSAALQKQRIPGSSSEGQGDRDKQTEEQRTSLSNQRLDHILPNPDDLEFDCFWRSILERMFAKDAVTDFNESAMGQYLKDHITHWKHQDCVLQSFAVAW